MGHSVIVFHALIYRYQGYSIQTLKKMFSLPSWVHCILPQHFWSKFDAKYAIFSPLDLLHNTVIYSEQLLNQSAVSPEQPIVTTRSPLLPSLDFQCRYIVNGGYQWYGVRIPDFNLVKSAKSNRYFGGHPAFLKKGAIIHYLLTLNPE